MEREDPLQKYERTHQANSAREGKLKIIMYALIAVALGLGITLVVVISGNHTLVNELEQEKEALAVEIENLQMDYENLSSEYDSINVALDSSREEIAQLVEKVKQTQATDRALISRYQKELGTLRSIMRNYVVQIDSLNTLNHKLTEEAATARKDADTQRSRNKVLTAKVEEMSGKIAGESILRGRNLHAEAYGDNNKSTDKSNKAVRLLVNLTLMENTLAETGPVRVYVRVTDPDGNLLDDGHGASFSCGGSTLKATASREIDYEGSDIDLGIYVNNIASFTKGIYSIQAYANGNLLGSTELMLR